MSAAELIELADRLEAIGIANASILAAKGAGTHYAELAANSLVAAASLRAITLEQRKTVEVGHG